MKVEQPQALSRPLFEAPGKACIPVKKLEVAGSAAMKCIIEQRLVREGRYQLVVGDPSEGADGQERLSRGICRIEAHYAGRSQGKRRVFKARIIRAKPCSKPISEISGGVCIGITSLQSGQ